jgi:hypothetical protein
MPGMRTAVDPESVPSVVEKIEAGLEIIREPSDTPTPAEPVAAVVTPTPEIKPADVTSEAKVATPDAAAVAPTPALEVVELPAEYIRAAVHQGWTADEVAALHKQNPDLALKTLSNLYASTNSASAEWAAIGRAKATTQPTPAPESAKVDTGVDVTALEKEYGADDPLVKQIKVLDAFVRKSVAVTPAAAPVQNDFDAVRQAQVNAETAKQVDGYFHEPGMETNAALATFYGKAPIGAEWRSHLTPVQLQNRAAVMQEADAIMAGATLQGRTMTVGEALDRAHSIVAKSVLEAEVFAKVKASVSKRGNSLTIQPSKSGTTQAAAVTSGKPATREELEQRVEQRLAKLRT